MEQEHVMSVIRKHWDVRSSAFNIDHDADTINRWENVLLDLLGADRNKSVVDLGTGTGFLANITGKLGYPTIGIDISKEMLRYAVQRGERCGSSAIYMEGNASNLPFVAGSIDYIINARFLWTLMEPEKTFMEWYRIIKPGGGYSVFQYYEGRSRHYGQTEKEGALS